jgi:hypothetical protein
MPALPKLIILTMSATQACHSPLALQSASTAVSLTGFGVSVQAQQVVLSRLAHGAASGDLNGCRLGTVHAQPNAGGGMHAHVVQVRCESFPQDPPVSNRSENLRPRDALYSDLWLPRPILTHVILKLPRTLPTVDGRWIALAAYSVAAKQEPCVLRCQRCGQY